MRKLSGRKKEAELPSACWVSHNSLLIISLLLMQWKRVLPPLLIGLGQAMCLGNKHLRSTQSSHRPLRAKHLTTYRSELTLRSKQTQLSDKKNCAFVLRL